MSKVISFSAAVMRQKAIRTAARAAAPRIETEEDSLSWCDLAKEPGTLVALMALTGVSTQALHHSAR